MWLLRFTMIIPPVYLKDSDDNQPNSPKKRRAPSIPRNAEELACHLLHGSLRMTASRQQILSHSGIRLEERAKEEKEKKEEKLEQPQSVSNLLDKPCAPGHQQEVFSESLDEATCLFSDDEDSDLKESSSDYEPDIETKAVRKVHKRSKFKGDSSSQSRYKTNSRTKSSTTSKLPRRRHSQKERRGRTSLGPIKKSKSDTYVSKLKAKEMNYEHRVHRKSSTATTQNGSTRTRGPGRPSKQVWGSNDSLIDEDNQPRKSHRQKRRQRLNSSGVYCTSASEVEPEVSVNGFTPSTTLAPPTATPALLNPVRHINPKNTNDRVFDVHVRTRGHSNSSSQYETAGEGYSSEDKHALSPFSDINRFSAIPSASSVEDLTVFDPLANRRGKPGRKPGRKRKGSFRTEVGGLKKIRLTSESSDAGSGGGELKTRTVNGLIPNGGQYEIKPLDLVWAKCRGYPSYPALVSDVDTILKKKRRGE